MNSKWWTVYRALTGPVAIGVLSGLVASVAFGFLGWVWLRPRLGPIQAPAAGVVWGWLLCLCAFGVWMKVSELIEKIPESEPPERIKNAIKRRQTKDHDKRGGVSFVANEGGEITEVEQ